MELTSAQGCTTFLIVLRSFLFSRIFSAISLFERNFPFQALSALYLTLVSTSKNQFMQWNSGFDFVATKQRPTFDIAHRFCIWVSRFLFFLRCEGVPGKAVKEHVGAKPNLEYTLTLSGQKKRRSDNCELRCHMSQKHMLYHAPWVEKHCQRRKLHRWTTLERDTERSSQLGSDLRWYYQPLEDRGHSGPRLLCWSSGFVAPKKTTSIQMQ